MRFPYLRYLGTAITACCLSAPSAFGCGIDWSLPKFHFDSVNEWGYVSYWEDIGSMKMGKKDIPIRIHFLSNRKSSSPYAGYGWSVPLLESRMVQVNEHSFKMWQPDGRFRDFGRDSGNPNLLNGQGGWKAEIRGDTIKAYADCGWGLSFKNGKISSLSTPDGKTYGYRYEGGKVKSIKEVQSGEEVVEVVEDPLEPGLLKLKMGDETIVLEQGEKPRIEQINGQNLIGGMDTCLTRIVKADGSERELSFEVEPDNIVPSFRPDAGRKITWEPSNGIVSQDRDWKYEVKQDQGHAWNNAAITRQDSSNGGKEHWHKNRLLGVRTVIKLSGTKIVTIHHKSGEMRGKIRKRVMSKEDKNTKVEKYFYDVKGNLSRKEISLDNDHIILYYSKSNEKHQIVRNLEINKIN